ncbi:MAG: CBS domain-containing protein [Motiliproteus sp.]
MQNITAQDFMDRSPLSFSPDIGVISALRQLLAANLSGAPVVDSKNAVIGFLSEADCLRGTLMGGYHSSVGELVRDRMTQEVETITPSTNIVDIAETFLNNNRRVLPVVKEGKIVGLIQRQGVLQQLIEQIDHQEYKIA